VKEQLRRALALCREVAYITLSSFRVKRLFCFSLSVFNVAFAVESCCPGGLLAVVPCQWRRIIGGNSEVTRINSKKEFNRSLFNQIRC
ncbi:hypothetical protein, partial [Klebsiella quasipneumoniae]